MTWTKLSDDFTDDCWELSDGAHRLHIEALVWSNRKLLNCRIIKKDVARWAKHPDPDFISELINCGWWEDDDDTYVIIHHSVYQRTREQVLRQQKANQRNGKQSGRERERRRGSATNDSFNDSLNESPNEMDGTGRDGPGQRNRGTSLSNGQPKMHDPDLDADYAADLQDWYGEQP